MPIQIKWLTAVACFCLVLLASCGNGIEPGSTRWQYTALGDSLAVGVLDSQGGYVRRYDNYIVTDRGVNVSRYGLTTVVDLAVSLLEVNQSAEQHADIRSGLPICVPQVRFQQQI